MSLIDPLLRFIDPVAYREREAERRRAREARPEQPDPDVSPTAPARAEPRIPARRCRVCGQVDDSRYCLVCLADTMEEEP
jgi:hypothetical protein